MAWVSSNPASVLDAYKLSYLESAYQNTFALDKGERVSGCLVKRAGSGDVSFANATPQTITWTGEDWDTDNYWASGNPTRIYNNKGADGWFSYAGIIGWAGTANAGVSRVELSGAADYTRSMVPFPADVNYPHRHAYYIVPFLVLQAQYHEIVALQKTGGAINLISAATICICKFEK